ncbi:PIR protein [Plasmodium vivax]|uniref:VIR protein n=1 Tax=Plasmodium vivax TaxID=5855 RepID=A0A564ZNY9_PLAVI|nr:PIR protein [Plasmodium vivax]
MKMGDKLFKEAVNLLKDEKEHLSSSKLYSLYETFNNEEEFSNNYEICSYTKDTFHESKKFNPNSTTICKHLGNVIEKFDDFCVKHVDSSKCCNYLNYWLYDKIIEGNYDVYNIYWIYNKFRTFMEKKFAEFENKYECNDKLLPILDVTLLKNKSALYNFLEYYDSIKAAFNAETSNRGKYCEYIKYIFNLYLKIQEEYNLKPILAYSDEIENFRSKFSDTTELNFLKGKCYDNSEKYISAISDTIKKPLREKHVKKYDKVTNELDEHRQIVDYDIFDHVHAYQEGEYISKHPGSGLGVYGHYCNKGKDSSAEKDNDLKQICEYFIKYFVFLAYDFLNIPPEGNKYNEYLNYWLNKKLKEINKSATQLIEFIDERFDSNFYAYDKYVIFKNKVYNMNEDIFNKMNILYDLYDNYNKFISETSKKENCSNYANNFLQSYEKAMKKSYETNSAKLYNALMEFSVKYKDIKENSKFCKSTDLPKLPNIIKIKEDEKKVAVSEALKACKSIKTKTSVSLPSESILEKLPAYTIYNKLNETSIDESTCANYCGNVIAMGENNEQVQLLCAKLVTNLKKLSTMSDVGKTPKDRCSYLTHWSYYNIMNLFRNNLNNVQNTSLLNELNDVILNVNENVSKQDDRCKYYLYGIWDEWKKQKDLHDYFENYDKIKECVDKPKESNCNKYCEYLSYINTLYKKYIKECCTCFKIPKAFCEENCPKHFKCDEKYYPYNIMSKMKCDNKTQGESWDEIIKTITIDDGIRNVDQGIRGIDKKVLRKNETVSNEEQVEVISTCDGLLCDPFYKFVLAAFSFLGIFSVLFIFYKFTPLGFNFHRRKQIENQIVYDFHQEYPRDTLNKKSKSNNTISKNRRVQIAYQAT